MQKPKNIVTKAHLKPQLVRKRVLVKVPKTAKIVTRPKVVPQQAQTPKPKPKPTQVGKGVDAHRAPKQNNGVRIRNPARQAVVRDHSRRKLKTGTKVKYITRDPSPESKNKIALLKDSGVGKFLVIIGNGPSLNLLPTDKLRGNDKVDTLSINKPDKRVWPTTHWAFFDPSQMRRHKDDWMGYGGKIFNSPGIKDQKINSMQFKNLGGKGFSKNPLKGIHIGRSSVFASMQIALWMNYNKIFIVGCDMNPEGIDGKLHFYGENPDVQPDIRGRRFAAESEYYELAANSMDDRERDKFCFCSEGINPWPFMSRYKTYKAEGVIDEIIKLSESL